MNNTTQDFAKELKRLNLAMKNKTASDKEYRKRKREIRTEAAYWGISFDDVITNSETNKNKYLKEIQDEQAG